MWKLLLIIAFTASHTTVNSCSTKDIKNNNENYMRTQAGNTDLMKNAFIVTIERTGDDTIMCPGVIINNHWVASLEHCMKTLLEKTDVDLIATTHDKEQQSIVELVKFQPKEERASIEVAIALVKLQTDLVFSDTVHPPYLFTAISQLDGDLARLNITGSLDWIQATMAEPEELKEVSHDKHLDLELH